MYLLDCSIFHTFALKRGKLRFEDTVSNPFFEEDSDSESENEEISTETTEEESQGLKHPIDPNLQGKRPRDLENEEEQGSLSKVQR